MRCTLAWRGRCYPSPPCRGWSKLTPTRLNVSGTDHSLCNFKNIPSVPYFIRIFMVKIIFFPHLFHISSIFQMLSTCFSGISASTPHFKAGFSVRSSRASVRRRRRRRGGVPCAAPSPRPLRPRGLQCPAAMGIPTGMGHGTAVPG